LSSASFFSFASFAPCAFVLSLSFARESNSAPDSTRSTPAASARRNADLRPERVAVGSSSKPGVGGRHNYNYISLSVYLSVCLAIYLYIYVRMYIYIYIVDPRSLGAVKRRFETRTRGGEVVEQAWCGWEIISLCLPICLAIYLYIYVCMYIYIVDPRRFSTPQRRFETRARGSGVVEQSWQRGHAGDVSRYVHACVGVCGKHMYVCVHIYKHI